jgi:predicted nucleic acid-binding protein
MKLKLPKSLPIGEAATVTPKLTFIDSGVLISAFRGNLQTSLTAGLILDDSTRTFASSAFVQLETLPKANYHQQQSEQDFYNTFFAAVTHWASDLDAIVEQAQNIGSTYGIAAMDALHIAAALTVGAEEFVTTEKPSKPMFRVREITVHSVFQEL